MLENELLRLDENSLPQSCKKDYFNRFFFTFVLIRSDLFYNGFCLKWKSETKWNYQNIEKKFGVLIAEFQNPKQDLSAFCVKVLISGRSGGPNPIKPKSGHWKIQRGALSAALISTLPSHCFLIQVYSNKFSFNHFSPIFRAPVPFSKSPKHSTCFSFANCISFFCIFMLFLFDDFCYSRKQRICPFLAISRVIAFWRIFEFCSKWVHLPHSTKNLAA